MNYFLVHLFFLSKQLPKFHKNYEITFSNIHLYTIGSLAVRYTGLLLKARETFEIDRCLLTIQGHSYKVKVSESRLSVTSPLY